VLSRRSFIHAGAGVLAAPFINRGQFSLFAGTLDQYSSLTVDLVRESTVIDMLGLLTLDFKKLDAWRTRPASFRLSDFERLKDSGITVFHPAVGYVEGDIYAASSADITGWDAFSDAYPQYFIRVCSPADVVRAKSEGKLGIIVGQQNSNPRRHAVHAQHCRDCVRGKKWIERTNFGPDVSPDLRTHFGRVKAQEAPIEGVHSR